MQRLLKLIRKHQNPKRRTGIAEGQTCTSQGRKEANPGPPARVSSSGRGSLVSPPRARALLSRRLGPPRLLASRAFARVGSSPAGPAPPLTVSVPPRVPKGSAGPAVDPLQQPRPGLRGGQRRGPPPAPTPRLAPPLSGEAGGRVTQPGKGTLEVRDFWRPCPRPHTSSWKTPTTAAHVHVPTLGGGGARVRNDSDSDV